MTYHHLVEKILDYQDKIRDHINKFMSEDELPPDLVAKADAADAWGVEADEKLGKAEVPTMAPNIDPVLDYSNALWMYKGMFDEKVVSEINEYRELVEELFDMVKNPSPHDN